MLDIAVNGGEGACVSIRDIAERESLSEKYLEQIINSLSRAGLVRSVRGAKGGYLLSRTAGEITVEDILLATEGSLAPMSCAEDNESCDKYGDCVMSFIWTQMYEAVSQVVKKITLADLVDRKTQKG